MDNPLISVIVPVYNAEPNLRQCLDSILNQTLKEIEIICVDDGSTDKSLKILKEYQQKDNRITILQQQNKYAGVARNTGLRVAKGRYLSFLDADDFFQSNMLEDMYKKAEIDNSDIVICGWFNYNNKLKTVTKSFNFLPKFVALSPFSGKLIANDLFTFSKPNAWTKLYRHSFFQKHNLQFENCKCYNDMTCVYLSYILAERISVINKCYVYYRNNQTSNLTSQWNKNFESLLYATSRLEGKMINLGVYEIFKVPFIQRMVKRILLNYQKIPVQNQREARDKAKELLFADMFESLPPQIKLSTTKLAPAATPKSTPTIKPVVSSDGVYNTYGITPNTLNYKTYKDLSTTIKNNISKLPTDTDLVVGIPRSGMIPAYMIALMLSKQACSLREFISGDFESVATYRVNLNKEIKNVLIIDDSINTGRASEDTKALIKEKGLDKKYNIKYAAIYYKNDDYKKYIDIALEKVPQPRLFQWNYLNHTYLKDAAFDIDGVLCIDPTNEENDDGPKYKKFLLNAKPLFIPKYKIPYIITTRLEKYRSETEEWLKKHNVQYDHLVLLDGYTAEERRRLNVHGKFKAEQYKQLKDIQLFIESDRKQAEEIANLTGKLCFCASTDELFGRK